MYFVSLDLDVLGCVNMYFVSLDLDVLGCVNICFGSLGLDVFSYVNMYVVRLFHYLEKPVASFCTIEIIRSIP
jgi:hypothetical protein